MNLTKSSGFRPHVKIVRHLVFGPWARGRPSRLPPVAPGGRGDGRRQLAPMLRPCRELMLVAEGAVLPPACPEHVCFYDDAERVEILMGCHQRMAPQGAGQCHVPPRPPL